MFLSHKHVLAKEFTGFRFLVCVCFLWVFGGLFWVFLAFIPIPRDILGHSSQLCPSWHVLVFVSYWFHVFIWIYSICRLSHTASLWSVCKTSSSPTQRNWKWHYKEKLPPRLKKSRVGTISKSWAPYSMIQFDILIKVTMEEGQRGNERKRVTFQVAEENPSVDLACRWKRPQLPKLITCGINSGRESQTMHLCKSAPAGPLKLISKSKAGGEVWGAHAGSCALTMSCLVSQRNGQHVSSIKID